MKSPRSVTVSYTHLDVYKRQAGASLGFAGSRMGAWINAGVTSEPDYMLVAAPYPTLEKGAQPEFGQIDNQYTGPASVAITTSCKDVERAARLLDYAYGCLLYTSRCV